MNDETVFSDVPEEMAIKWHEKGAERLHMVDLDGAVQGKPINRDAIKRIVDAIPIPVELGGGIRDMATVEAYFDLGVHYLILGTVAYKDPDFVKSACRAFPDKIISTHVSDNDMILDHHQAVGEGKIDFKKVFKRLVEIGFKGTLNIELGKNEDRLLSKQRMIPMLKELGVPV